MSNEGFYAGIDVGTSYIKAVCIDGGKQMVASHIDRTGAGLQDAIGSAVDNLVEGAGIGRENIRHTTATGFGRNIVDFAGSTRTEISCHAKGVFYFFPQPATIIDIGGQDTKIIRVDTKGHTLGFKMNRKCAAGTGAFLEEIALRLNVSPDEMNRLAASSERKAALNSYCTVFAKTEILTRIKDGEKVEDMARGAFESVVRRVLEMDTLEGTIIMTGGVVAHNDTIVHILEELVGAKILTPEHPQLTGAMGAALFAIEA